MIFAIGSDTLSSSPLDHVSAPATGGRLCEIGGLSLCLTNSCATKSRIAGSRQRATRPRKSSDFSCLERPSLKSGLKTVQNFLVQECRQDQTNDRGLRHRTETTGPPIYLTPDRDRRLARQETKTRNKSRFFFILVAILQLGATRDGYCVFNGAPGNTFFIQRLYTCRLELHRPLT